MRYHLDWIIDKFDRGEDLRFIFFWGHTPASIVGKFIFSQWCNSPFTVDGVVYPTSEHWMMASKANLFGDKSVFDRIMNSTKPGEAKELGRQVQNFDEAIWDQKKFDIVRQGNIHKFSQNADFRKYLLGTGDQILCEASPVDPVWGIGLAQDSKMIENPHTWQGQNLLGFALMEVRDFLRESG